MNCTGKFLPCCCVFISFSEAKKKDNEQSAMDTGGEECSSCGSWPLLLHKGDASWNA